MTTAEPNKPGANLVPFIAGHPEAPEDVTRLTIAIMQFQEATDALDDAAAEYMDLNRSEMRCMSVLTRGPQSASALAEITALTRGAVTAMVDRLESRGLVARHPVHGDRRRVAIALTEKALAVAQAVYGPLAAEGFEITNRYTAAEMAVLTRYLNEGRDLQMRHAARVRAMALE